MHLKALQETFNEQHLTLNQRLHNHQFNLILSSQHQSLDEAQDLARQTCIQLSTPQNSSLSSQRANDRERLVNIVNSGYKFVIPITVYNCFDL
jgi:deoxyinosine 3'endonuclease (endonuclease V)